MYNDEYLPLNPKNTAIEIHRQLDTGHVVLCDITDVILARSPSSSCRTRSCGPVRSVSRGAGSDIFRPRNCGRARNRIDVTYEDHAAHGIGGGYDSVSFSARYDIILR